MPCDSGHCEHTAREKESGIVLEFLKEIRGQKFNHDAPDYYGHPESLDRDTAFLCEWIQKNLPAINGMSLELQLWWQRHKKHDAEREERERDIADLALTRKKALAKLSANERKALGLKD